MLAVDEAYGATDKTRGTCSDHTSILRRPTVTLAFRDPSLPSSWTAPFEARGRVSGGGCILTASSYRCRSPTRAHRPSLLLKNAGESDRYGRGPAHVQIGTARPSLGCACPEAYLWSQIGEDGGSVKKHESTDRKLSKSSYGHDVTVARRCHGCGTQM